MLVSAYSYFGVPKNLIPDMEKVAQGILDEMLRRVQEIHRTQTSGKQSHGDLDFTVYKDTLTEDRTAFERLRIQDHSAGWWAVLQWGKPHPDLNGYEDMLDFRAHAHEGALPATIDWWKLREDWGYGRCALHWQARCHQGSWSGNSHNLGFTHPLMHALGEAMGEMATPIDD